jgi:hypothetical protein
MKNNLAKYRHASKRAANWLVTQLQPNGSYKLAQHDLACYYKSPYLLLLAGYYDESNKVIDFIKNNFMQSTGDFYISEKNKSENPAFNEFWGYTNTWVAITAQKLGRFDISYPAYNYLQSFYHPILGAFTTHAPFGLADDVVDVLTTAHLGLLSLYFGDLKRAKMAGNFLCQALEKQSNRDIFYLRFDKQGAIIDTFPEEVATLFAVDATKPQQFYFMLGYPCAFLGLLYGATSEINYLTGAQAYLKFITACDSSLYQFYFSHKVAWAASIIYKQTKNKNYLTLAEKISNYLISIQNEQGVWLANEPDYAKFDQTAEIAIWLMEISQELEGVSTY